MQTQEKRKWGDSSAKIKKSMQMITDIFAHEHLFCLWDDKKGVTHHLWFLLIQINEIVDEGNHDTFLEAQERLDDTVVSHEQDEVADFGNGCDVIDESCFYLPSNPFYSKLLFVVLRV